MIIVSSGGVVYGGAEWGWWEVARVLRVVRVVREGRPVGFRNRNVITVRLTRDELLVSSAPFVKQVGNHFPVKEFVYLKVKLRHFIVSQRLFNQKSYDFANQFIMKTEDH